jgi:phospholipid/cholesterol/gamma-HCH transport system substrate-binding protein
MPKPFKFRYVNEIVGTFVLLIVLLLIVGIVLAGRAQEWFVPRYRLALEFPPEGSLGLRKGSEVEILGTTVGKIEKISVHEDGSMRGEVTIKGDFIQFVRDDSLAIAKKQFGVAGDAFVEITKGRGAPLADDQSLMLLKDTEIFEIAQNLLTQFQEAVLPLIEQIRKTAEEYGSLAADLRNTNGPLVMLLANLEQITQSLDAGEGSAGRILKDPKMADDLNGILEQVRAVLADVKATTAQLPAMAEKVGDEAGDLPGLMLQTQETLREAERLIDGIQQTWLVRGYIEQPQTGRLIKPSEVTAP